RREVEPLKMTSAISSPRRLFALCSPRIQRTASTILLLPLPLGPTTPVIPAAKSNCVLSAKLLKPTNSKRLSMPSPVSGQKSVVRSQWSEVSGQKSVVRGQRSEGQKSLVSGQRSAVRDQNSECRRLAEGQKSSFNPEP